MIWLDGARRKSKFADAPHLFVKVLPRLPRTNRTKNSCKGACSRRAGEAFDREALGRALMGARKGKALAIARRA